MSSPLTETDKGLRLLVRAVPKAGRSQIVGVRQGRLLVRVTAPPEGGKANAAVIKLLSKAWKLPASSFELVSGTASRDKVFVVRGTKAAEVRLEL